MTPNISGVEAFVKSDRNSESCNFVVLGHARCGSNLIGRALAMHPQIRMAGECLANDESTRKEAWERINPSAWSYPRGDGYQVGQDGATFLDQRIFAKAPFENIRAFGFKLFYEHAQFDDTIKTAWDYLASHDIRIVHLTRRNLLAAFVSREVATRTNQWVLPIEVNNPAAPPLPPFSIHEVVLQRYFDRITTKREWADGVFANHSVLKIDYESDLCENFEATANKVFELLGTMPWRSRPMLKKQRAVPLDAQLSNFEELRQHFQGSPYAEFFDMEKWPTEL